MLELDSRQFNISSPKPDCKQETTVVTDPKWNNKAKPDRQMSVMRG